MSTRSQTKASILLVGLPLTKEGPPMKVPWSDKPVSMYQEAVDARKQMVERGYTDFEIAGFKPDELMTGFTDKLKSKKWDVLVVGGGYKGIPDVVGGLETMINITKDVSPSTRIMFVAFGPLSVLQTVDRWEQLQGR